MITAVIVAVSLMMGLVEQMTVVPIWKIVLPLPVLCDKIPDKHQCGFSSFLKKIVDLTRREILWSTVLLNVQYD